MTPSFLSLAKGSLESELRASQPVPADSIKNASGSRLFDPPVVDQLSRRFNHGWCSVIWNVYRIPLAGIFRPTVSCRGKHCAISFPTG
jgi:hypothetical protein